MTTDALKDSCLGKKEAERSKNMFTLGLLSWMYHRPTAGTERYLREKFAKRPDLAEANVLAFRAGHAYGETTESFAVTRGMRIAQMVFARVERIEFRQVTELPASTRGAGGFGSTGR